MAAPSAPHRTKAIGQAVLPWLVGVAAFLLRAPLVELAAPSRCPGFLELIAIGALRSSPDLTAGTIFRLMQAVTVIAAVALFVMLASRTTGMAVAAATGLALGLSPVLAPTLAPPWEAAACAGCVAVPLVANTRYRAINGATAVSLMLLVCALLLPAWTIVAAIGCGAAAARGVWGGRVKWLAAAMASIAAAAIVLVTLRLSPPNALAYGSSWRAVAACVLPHDPFASVTNAATTIEWLLGPFVLALALLGAFLEAQRIDSRARFVVAAAVVACLAITLGGRMPLQIVLTPWVVGLWWLAASGLQEIVLSIGTGRSRRLASVLLLLLVPLLQSARFRGQERDDWVRPNGHEKATLREMTAVLNSVAGGATFVEEDSTFDLLLRAAAAGGRRSRKAFTVASADGPAIREALARGPVYAFPRGLEDLSLRGFASQPIAVAVRSGHGYAPVNGVATITASHPCLTATENWADLAGGTTGGRLAFAADSEAAQGPVIVFLGGATPAGPRPDAWPPRTERGFRLAVFDRATDSDRARLRDEAREYALPPSHPVLAAPFVVRLLLHRTPRAPRALAISLGAAFPRVAARLRANVAGAGRLTLCDAPAADVVPFGMAPD